MRRIGIYKKTVSKKKKKQPLAVPKVKYSGERIQIDVKYVPMECIREEEKIKE